MELDSPRHAVALASEHSSGPKSAHPGDGGEKNGPSDNHGERPDEAVRRKNSPGERRFRFPEKQGKRDNNVDVHSVTQNLRLFRRNPRLGVLYATRSPP